MRATMAELNELSTLTGTQIERALNRTGYLSKFIVENVTFIDFYVKDIRPKNCIAAHYQVVLSEHGVTMDSGPDLCHLFVHKDEFGYKADF